AIVVKVLAAIAGSPVAETAVRVATYVVPHSSWAAGRQWVPSGPSSPSIWLPARSSSVTVASTAFSVATTIGVDVGTSIALSAGSRIVAVTRGPSGPPPPSPPPQPASSNVTPTTTAGASRRHRTDRGRCARTMVASVSPPYGAPDRPLGARHLCALGARHPVC